MNRLVYSCYAQRDITNDDLAQISDASARRNQEWGVTGALLYSRRRFIQVLEGPRNRLFDLVDLILADPRASALRIEAIEPCSERLFSTWSMEAGPIADPCPARERVLTELIALFTAQPGAVAGTIELASRLDELRTLVEAQDNGSPQRSR